jgi:hypothetical protein
MRALTKEELQAVCGGDGGTVVVTAPRPLELPPGTDLMTWIFGPGWDAQELGTDYYLNTASRNNRDHRRAEFLRNTTISRNPDGTLTVTFNTTVTVTGSVPLTPGSNSLTITTGSSFTGTDRTGGTRGSPNGVPDLLDMIIDNARTIRWGN